jgi:hypothetical protein
MIILGQITTFIACSLTWQAHLWDTTGYGLNAWIALPAATLMMAIPHVYNALITFINKDSDRINDDERCGLVSGTVVQEQNEWYDDQYDHNGINIKDLP